MITLVHKRLDQSEIGGVYQFDSALPMSHRNGLSVGRHCDRGPDPGLHPFREDLSGPRVQKADAGKAVGRALDYGSRRRCSPGSQWSFGNIEIAQRLTPDVFTSRDVRSQKNRQDFGNKPACLRIPRRSQQNNAVPWGEP